MVTRATALPRLLYSQWLWLALFTLAFAPTLAWLFGRWTVSIWFNGHGIFVPLIVAYLVRDSFKRNPMVAEDSSAWGFLFVGAGLSMLVLDSAIRTQLLAAAGLIVCLPGLSLLLLGAQRTRSLIFPLALTPLMLPVPVGLVSKLYLGLRSISAWGSAHIVNLYGIPVLRDGTTLFLPKNVVEVADACSGFSTLYASVTLGLILSYLASSPGRRVLLMGSAVVLAVLCNMVRVAILTLIVHYWGVDPLETALHELSGMATFAVVLVALFAMADRTKLRAAGAQ